MRKKKEGLKVRGFLRTQIVNKDGSIAGDSGWLKNTVVDAGLIQLSNLITAAGNPIGYAGIATQTDAMDVTQVDLVGPENVYEAITASQYGTATSNFTCSFAGTNNSDTINLGAAGLFISNGGGDLFAGQTFASSTMSTAQDFKLTYEIRFATA